MTAHPPVVTLQGHRSVRVEQLARTAFSAVALGDWPQASHAADACIALADPGAQAEMVAHGETAAGIVAAVRGDAARAQRLLERSEVAAVRHGWTDLVDVVRLGRGIEALTADRYDEAWAQLRLLIDFPAASSTWVRLVAVGYLAEASTHCGCEPAAGAVLAAVEQQMPAASAASVQELRGVTALAYAVTGCDAASDPAFDRALAECPANRAFDRARIQLARGRTLRRRRRVRESRLPLHEALVVFEQLEATVWAEQTRSELRATGARRVRRELGDAESLTAQELQIVRMAAAGLTNREIGQRLYLSHRTIGSHLYRAFPKLGIAARSQLRDVLGDLAGEGAKPQAIAR